jgi:hypothetical protein
MNKSTNTGVRVRALMPITNLEDQKVYKTGETFVMYRDAAIIRALMHDCFLEILDGVESPAVVVSEVKTNGNNG